MDALRRLTLVHRDLDACKECPEMIGPVVHGPPVLSDVLLIGQAPGPREGSFGRPFAWTAGKTLFSWFQRALGIDEAHFRQSIYMAAVARCFPGKAKGGGDRKPAPDEIERCKRYLKRETQVLRPKLLIPVGALAIQEVTGHTGPLAEIIGTAHRGRYHGVEVDMVALPHPSGASTWHRMEPGKTLLDGALQILAAHPAMKAIVARQEPLSP